MARSAKRPKASVTFKHPVQVTAERPEFELLDAVSHLDVAALARKARAEIEIGYVHSGCCRQLVRAVVRKGMVTALKVQPCAGDESKRAPADLAAVLKAAQRRIAPRGGGGGRPHHLPMPVASFLARAPVITVDTITCVRICIFGVCVTCCEHLGNPDWICGRITIDTRVPS